MLRGVCVLALSGVRRYDGVAAIFPAQFSARASGTGAWTRWPVLRLKSTPPFQVALSGRVLRRDFLVARRFRSRVRGETRFRAQKRSVRFQMRRHFGSKQLFDYRAGCIVICHQTQSADDSSATRCCMLMSFCAIIALP